MKTLIMTTGIKDYLQNTFLPTLRDKGKYEGDILLLDYYNLKGSFTDEEIDNLKYTYRKNINILYTRTKQVYQCIPTDRFRAFLEYLIENDNYKKYDVIMNIDGNDINFFKDINPLFDIAKDKLCCVKERSLNKECKGWFPYKSIPKRYREAIDNNPIINTGMFLGPADVMLKILKFLSSEVAIIDNRFGADQLLFNALIYYHKEPFYSLSEEWDYVTNPSRHYTLSFVDGKCLCKDKYGEYDIAILHRAGPQKNMTKPEQNWYGKFNIPSNSIKGRVAIIVTTSSIDSKNFAKCRKAIVENTDMEYQLFVVESHIDEDIYNFSRDNNIILKGLEIDYYVFINDDVYVKPNWLEALIETVNNNKGVGIVGGLLLFPNGKVQCAGCHIEYYDDNSIDQVIIKNNYHYQEPKDVGEELYEERYCTHVAGALMLITKTCINKIGFLNEDLKCSWNDVEYCFRAWENDVKVMYQPRAVAIHEQEFTIKKIHGFSKKAYMDAWKTLHGKWKRKDIELILKKVNDSNELLGKINKIPLKVKVSIPVKKVFNDRYYKYKYPI